MVLSLQESEVPVLAWLSPLRREVPILHHGFLPARAGATVSGWQMAGPGCRITLILERSLATYVVPGTIPSMFWVVTRVETQRQWLAHL